MIKLFIINLFKLLQNEFFYVKMYCINTLVLPISPNLKHHSRISWSSLGTCGPPFLMSPYIPLMTSMNLMGSKSLGLLLLFTLDKLSWILGTKTSLPSTNFHHESHLWYFLCLQCLFSMDKINFTFPTPYFPPVHPVFTSHTFVPCCWILSAKRSA